MRLVVLGPGHPFRGGIATTTTAAVTALRQRGHQVAFLTPRRQYPRWLFPGRDGGVDPEACPRIDEATPVLDPLFPPAWPEGRRAARQQAADAWVLPFWTWAWAGWWRFLLAGNRPPAVAVVHNPADHDARPAQRLAARLVLARCEGLFTHARSLESALAADYPQIPHASHPLPSTSSSEAPPRDESRRLLQVSDDTRLAVFAGLIRPYKGVEQLLEAFARLPAESDWRLIVAGEPWADLGPGLQQRAARPDLRERVRLDLRWQSEEQLQHLLAAADLLVLPYREGSQSAMAPIALAYGVPVLSTRVGGLPEVVLDGVNGRLVEAGSVDALAAAIESLDRSTLQGLAEGARRTSSSLTWNGYAAALESLIERVLGHVPRVER